ncbi:MAG: zinc-ribbon domain-containing protein [Syntrophobacteraceae bacterium]
MKIQCKECKGEFTISDDKLPHARQLTIPCPNCKARLEIPGKQDSAASEDQNVTLQKEWVDPLLDENAIDLVEEGVKTALLCDTDVNRRNSIAQALQELDFWVVHAQHPSFALGKLRHNHYDIIVLDQNFQALNESENLVLHHMQILPMQLRRQFFLCLLSSEKTTLDAKLAFTMGVNLIINVKDLDKVKLLFARGLREYKNFYGLFNSELVKKDGRNAR